MKSVAISRRVFLAGAAGTLLGGSSPGEYDPPAAARFVDSVGVNIHLSSEPYASRFQLVRSLLAASGIRHVRDELRPGNNFNRWRELFFQEKVRSHLLVSPATNTVTQMLDYLSALGVDKVSAIEGQNEGDSDWFKAQRVAHGDWSGAVVSYQREVFEALRSREDTGSLPVLSPTVLDFRPGDVERIRPAADFCDAVAIHAYAQHGEDPETSAPYASLSWYLQNMRDGFKPGAPVMVTETGYNNLVRAGGGGVSEAAAAIYLPRLLLNNFAAGIRRTFLYELLDEGLDPNEPEQHWGLVRYDGARKPAFHAISALLGAFQDTAEGSNFFAGETVRAALRGAPPLSKLLQFQKADGTMILAVWRAIGCWDAARAVETGVALQPLTVALDRPVSHAAFMVPNDGTAWTDIAISAGEFVIPVGAKLVLVRLHGPGT
jgi:hypothetical protein